MFSERILAFNCDMTSVEHGFHPDCLQEMVRPKMLSEVPGIIEARMAITPNQDGTVSFTVLIGLECDGDAGRDLIELIINPEHFHRALAGAKIRGLARNGSEKDEEAPTFPCHVGFSGITP
jgi:hypothetical protein